MTNKIQIGDFPKPKVDEYLAVESIEQRLVHRGWDMQKHVIEFDAFEEMYDDLVYVIGLLKPYLLDEESGNITTVEMLKDDISDLETENMDLEDELEEARSDASALESELEDVQEERDELLAKVKAYEEAIKPLEKLLQKSLYEFDCGDYVEDLVYNTEKLVDLANKDKRK